MVERKQDQSEKVEEPKAPEGKKRFEDLTTGQQLAALLKQNKALANALNVLAGEIDKLKSGGGGGGGGALDKLIRLYEASNRGGGGQSDLQAIINRTAVENMQLGNMTLKLVLRNAAKGLGMSTEDQKELDAAIENPLGTKTK